MPTAQQLLAERARLEALIASNRATLAQQEQTLADARARNLNQRTINLFQDSVNRTQSLVNAQENLLRINNQQIASSNQPTTANPPDPQVQTAPSATPRPTPTTLTANNPPNPQVPGDTTTPGSLRIDITTTNPVNENINPQVAQPGTAPIIATEVPPAINIPEVNVIPPTPGITGPVAGISPYGEEDELFDPNFVTQPNPALFTEEYVQNQDNPVEIPQDQDTGFSPYGEEDDLPNLVEASAPAPADSFTAYFDVETGRWNVRDDNTGNDVYSGLTEQQAILKEQDLNAGSVGYYYGIDEVAEQADLGGDLYSTQQLATLETARQQQILRAQQKQANQGDWRVKLRLAPGANYLYDDPNDPGILAPLSSASGTGGVVFPYTPQITTSYNANYNSYDLTHSNYRGYFYQNSYVGDVQLQATFTAQDSNEAEYLLAVIHFFRSVTKMFYGNNDAYAGTPPPLVFLEGLGQFQFNRHPCVVSQFNYTLPDGVDYIRARSPNVSSTNLLFRRTRQDLPTNAFSSAFARLQAAGLFPGATVGNRSGVNVPTFGTASPTYVPTRIDIQLILLPMQSRQQVSQGFNLKEFASGKLIQKGFW